MAGGETASDRWRDEDGIPSPAEEFGGEDWWLKYERAKLPLVMPHDHGSYLKELYDEIATLRREKAELQAELAAVRARTAA